MVWRYIWNVIELGLIFVAWVLFFDYESDGDYDFPVKIEDYEEPKKKKVLQWMRAIAWVIVLFGLVVAVSFSLVTAGIIQTPMRFGDALVVLLTLLGSLFLINALRTQWRLLND